MMTEPVSGGPAFAWHEECPCYRRDVDFREIKIHNACEWVKPVPYLRSAFAGMMRYCWFIEWRGKDEEEDLVKAITFLNRCLGDVRAKKFAGQTHDTLTRKISSFDV